MLQLSSKGVFHEIFDLCFHDKPIWAPDRQVKYFRIPFRFRRVFKKTKVWKFWIRIENKTPGSFLKIPNLGDIETKFENILTHMGLNHKGRKSCDAFI